MTRSAVGCALVVLTACLVLLGSPGAADAQPPGSPRRVGVLLVGWLPEQREVQEFRQGLRDAGYSEGRDVVIEWRSAHGEYDRVPELVVELVQSKVDVIVVDGTVATQAAKRATSTIPIVMAIVADPVGSGLVATLSHPGGHVTGLSLKSIDLAAKRLELLREVIPTITRVAVLGNPDTPYHAAVIEELKAAAASLSIRLTFVSLRTADQIGPAFTAVSRAHAQALYVIDDPFFNTHQTALIQLALKARLPTVSGPRAFAAEGGLMSYGTNYGAFFRRSAWYVDKILKGVNPSDLPVEQPTRFELVMNLKTAKALRLSIPDAVLLRADEVIR